MKKFITLITLMFFILGVAGPSWAALTITNEVKSVWGNKKVASFDVAFDSSYAYGGETLDLGSVGIVKDEMVIINSTKGYTFEYDYDNNTIKVFAPAPPIVFEESVTLADSGGVSVGTLQYPAAYIMYVSSGLTAYHAVSPELSSPGKFQYIPTLTYGTRGSLNFGNPQTDASGVSVTYITQAWHDIFTNRQTAYMTAGATTSTTSSTADFRGGHSGINLGEEALAIESITWYDSSATTPYPLKPLVKGQTAAAGEVSVDWTIGSGTSIGFTQDLGYTVSGDILYVTYITKPSSPDWLNSRFVEEDTILPVSDIVELTSGLAASTRALIYGTGGYFPADTTEVAELVHSGVSIRSSTSSTAYYVQPIGVDQVPVYSGVSAHAKTDSFLCGFEHLDTNDFGLTYVAGEAGEIPGLVPLEVRNGKDLSDVSGVHVIVIGR